MISNLRNYARLTSNAGYDGSLLDSRRLLKTVGVDTTEELFSQVHLVEVIGNLVPIALHIDIILVFIMSHWL